VAQDQIEFLNGTTLSGKILEIRKPDKEFDFETSIGGRTISSTYSYAKVHAVVLNGKRFVLTPKSDEAEETSASTAANDKSALPRRTRAEVLKLIDQAGNTPPEWFETTPLDIPKTLEVDWPLKADGGWDNQKNVGQYIWDVVNPNESRWPLGIKLVHRCMELHREDPVLLQRDMDKLATMYFTLLQDYARAAFWYQRSGAQVNQRSGVDLAECYWRLGNKDMALSMLKGNSLPHTAIKLLGDMGEIDQALRLAKAYENSRLSNEAMLTVADALRKVGRFDEAIGYYQRVVDSDSARNEEYQQRFKARAAGGIEAIRLFERADVSRVAEGVYRDESTGYNGPLQVEVRVAAGRIETIKITAHREKQFYAALTDTPRQIISKQAVLDIDGTSGATITSQAIIHATARALSQGVK
jgi:uncharacterized protein with FMN-binding domain